MNKNLDKKSAERERERERVVNSSLAVFTNKYMNKKLKPFGRFFVSGFVFVFILASLTFVSSTLPIQAYAESTSVVTSTVSPAHSGWNSFTGKVGDIFKFIFGIKDKVATPIVTTPTPQVVNNPTTIIQQIAKAGLTGNTGPQGLRGFTGPQGLNGDKGESGTSFFASPELLAQAGFVTKSFFDMQVDRIYDSTSNSIQGLSISLGKEINTKLLTVSGDTTVGGNLTVTGNIIGNVIGNSNTVTNGVYTNTANLMTNIAPLTTLAESWIGPSSTTGIYFKDDNVGIGTTSPNAKLDVNGNINSNEIKFNTKKPQALVTFMFDDGTISTYTVMKPVFDAQEVVGVPAIITDLIGTTADYLTWSQVVELQNDGWEIASHSKSHPDMRTLTETQLRVELGNSKQALKDHGLGVDNFVYPSHYSNETVRRITKEYYRSARGGPQGVNPHVLNTYNLNSVLFNSATLATHEAQVDTAVSNNEWVIFYLHGTTSTDATAINTFINYIKSKGVSIVTVNQALDLVGNEMDNGDNFALGEKGIRANFEGNVGIGTVTPLRALDVQGTVSSIGTLTQTGTGLSDLTLGGTYNNSFTQTLRIKITTTGTPDKFDWSIDGGTTWAGTGVLITGTAQTLISTGATVRFGATTEHTLNDYWQATLTPSSGIVNASGYYINNALFATANGMSNENILIGMGAMGAGKSTGRSNVAIGYWSLYANTTGSQSTATGYYSLTANTTGTQNTANGYYSLNANTIGSQNTANGFDSLYWNTTGSSNTASGANSLYYNSTGNNNTVNGYYSLFRNSTGNNNTVNGYYSLYTSGQKVTAGSFITGVSYTIITTGTTDFVALSAANNNVGTVFTSNGVGSGTGTATSNSNNNTAYGYQAGRYLANGGTALSAPSNSLFIGYNTMASADGLTNENVIGYGAIGSGSNTIKLGNNAITGTYFDGNIAKILGMDRNTTGNPAGGLTLSSGGATLAATNKAGGDLTLKSGISTGTGSSAMHFFTTTASTTGTTDNTPTEKMTILGNGNVGVGVTPAYRLHIFENRADYAAAVINDGNVADRSGLLIQAGLDDNSVAGPSTLIGFKDGDGTAIGSITFGSNAVAYNTTSDERLKTLVNEKTLSSLNTLNQIQIHDFTWNNDTSNDIYSGVFAQELYDIYPHAVTKPIKDSDYWMVDYSKLTPLLVKSVQELNLKVEDLTISNTTVGYENKTFIERFFGGLINWFADSANGIGKIFVKEVNTDKVNAKEICINGTCVNEAELLYIRNTMDKTGISAPVSTNEDKKIDNAENTDICPNIDGVQTEIPTGDEINIDGECVVITGGDTGDANENTPDTTAPVITLSGESSVTLKVGDPYTEAGATAKDDIDTSVTVDINGTVDTATAGTYTITYNAKDAADNHATEVTRTVTVE